MERSEEDIVAHLNLDLDDLDLNNEADEDVEETATTTATTTTTPLITIRAEAYAEHSAQELAEMERLAKKSRRKLATLVRWIIDANAQLTRLFRLYNDAEDMEKEQPEEMERYKFNNVEQTGNISRMKIVYVQCARRKVEEIVRIESILYGSENAGHFDQALINAFSDADYRRRNRMSE
jgi:hypothetical protein